MTAVSQIIPNFVQGINEQPDELKKPGQVRDAVNCIPDVTKGLVKRPGYGLLMEMDNMMVVVVGLRCTVKMRTDLTIDI